MNDPCLTTFEKAWYSIRRIGLLLPPFDTGSLEFGFYFAASGASLRLTAFEREGRKKSDRRKPGKSQ